MALFLSVVCYISTQRKNEGNDAIHTTSRCVLGCGGDRRGVAAAGKQGRSQDIIIHIKTSTVSHIIYYFIANANNVG